MKTKLLSIIISFNLISMIECTANSNAAQVTVVKRFADNQKSVCQLACVNSGTVSYVLRIGVEHPYTMQRVTVPQEDVCVISSIAAMAQQSTKLPLALIMEQCSPGLRRQIIDTIKRVAPDLEYEMVQVTLYNGQPGADEKEWNILPVTNSDSATSDQGLDPDTDETDAKEWNIV